MVSEEVLVVQNSLLSSHLQDKTGCLITERTEEIYNIILCNQVFMPRDDAEYDFQHKQVIPYVIIRYGKEYLLLRRSTRQTEKRLHYKYSLGLGGHINPISPPCHDKNNLIIEGLYKELNEEVYLNDPADMNFIGIINDERNTVSKVHLGLLYVLEVLSPGYRVLETEKMTARWASRDNLNDCYDELETWSQIVYDQYINNKI